MPAGWRDDTLVTLTAPGAACNLTLTRDTPGGATVDVMAYARQQENAVAAQRPTGYRAVALDKVTIGGVVAVVAERELLDARKQPLVQRQAFVGHGKDVVIVTATAARAERARAVTALDDVVASLTFGAT